MNTSRREYEAALATNIEAIRQFALSAPQAAPVDAVLTAIAALPVHGVGMGDYARVLNALVRHLLAASDAADRYRCTWNGHRLLDAAHEVEAAAEWFVERQRQEDDGAADEGRRT